MEAYAEGDAIVLKPINRVPPDLIAEARAMKPELLTLLRAETGNDQADPADAAEAAAIRAIDYTPPPPGQPWRIEDYQRHKRHLDGL